jgi:hypothetical protein
MMHLLPSRTSYNSVFAVRFAHSNTFGTSQARKPLGEIIDETNGALGSIRKNETLQRRDDGRVVTEICVLRIR